MAFGVTEDIQKIETEINSAVAASLPKLGNVLKDALATHIQTDVYDAYSPRVYKRRSEHIGYGTPLIDVDQNANVTISKNEIELEYLPTGEHFYNPKWHLRDGDKLISWIESAHEDIPARPFWQNFEKDVELSAEALVVGYVAEATPELEISL